MLPENFPPYRGPDEPYNLSPIEPELREDTALPEWSLYEWGHFHDAAEELLAGLGWELPIPFGEPTYDRTLLVGVPPESLNAETLRTVQLFLRETNPNWRCVFVSLGDLAIAVYPSAIRVGDGSAGDWEEELPAMLARMRAAQWTIDGPRIEAMGRVTQIAKSLVGLSDHNCWILACDNDHHRNLVPGYDVMFSPAFGLWLATRHCEEYIVTTDSVSGYCLEQEATPLQELIEGCPMADGYSLLDWFLEKPAERVSVIRKMDRHPFFQADIKSLIGTGPIQID